MDEKKIELNEREVIEVYLGKLEQKKEISFNLAQAFFRTPLGCSMLYNVINGKIED